MNNGIQLLVSVRSVEEARIALAAQVDCIDVKEPAHGAMGRADYNVVESVVQVVAGKIPVSAALGEFADDADKFDERLLKLDLKYLKWGTKSLKKFDKIYDHSSLLNYQNRVVCAIYGDWYRCGVRSVEDVVKNFLLLPCPIFLIDTFVKDGKSLFECLSPSAIENLRKSKNWIGHPLALAGSLKWEDFDKIRAIKPDWVAVRGLVCEDGDRRNSIDPKRLERLQNELKNA